MDPAAFTYPVNPEWPDSCPSSWTGAACFPCSPYSAAPALVDTAPVTYRPIVQPVVEPPHSSDENMDEEYNAVNDVSNDHIFCTPCDAYTEYFNHENLYLQAVRY